MKKPIAFAAVLMVSVVAMPSATKAGPAALKTTPPSILAGASELHQVGRRSRRRKRRLATGAAIAIGVLGAAAAARAYHDDDDGYRDRRWRRHERRCRRWRRWCRDGEDRACWKYDNRC